MIRPVIKVDTSELNRAITQAAKNSSKTLAEIVNKKLKFVINAAIKRTIKASADEIRDLFNDPQDAGMLINWLRKKQGLPGLKGQKMAVAIRKEVTRRIRAVNFIRSQWKWALLDVIKVTGGTVSIKNATNRMGGAAPAPKGGTFSTVTASGWNDVRGGKEEASKVTNIKLAGVQEAIDAEAESTWAHTAEKELQQKVCDKFNRS